MRCFCANYINLNNPKHLFSPFAGIWSVAERRCPRCLLRTRTRTWWLSTSGCPAEQPAQTYCRSTSSLRSTSSSRRRSMLSRGSLWASLQERWDSNLNSTQLSFIFLETSGSVGCCWVTLSWTFASSMWRQTACLKSDTFHFNSLSKP